MLLIESDKLLQKPAPTMGYGQILQLCYQLKAIDYCLNLLLQLFNNKIMKKLAIIFSLSSLLLGSSFSPSLAQGRLDRPAFFRDGQEQMEQEIQRLQQQRT
jgi:H+/Cl- antiporter ClcA